MSLRCAVGALSHTKVYSKTWSEDTIQWSGLLIELITKDPFLKLWGPSPLSFSEAGQAVICDMSQRCAGAAPSSCQVALTSQDNNPQAWRCRHPRGHRTDLQPATKFQVIELHTYCGPLALPYRARSHTVLINLSTCLVYVIRVST